MTTPSSGVISISDVNTEIELASNFSSSLSFLNGFIKTSRPASPNLQAFYGLTYFQKNNDGNCANGNCTSNCNCGNIQCTNCTISGQVNCVNCDAQKWLQVNCNCACTYNCTTSQVSFNCDCACDCACGG